MQQSLFAEENSNWQHRVAFQPSHGITRED